MASHDWADLSAGSKNMYRDEGITAQTYNRWWRMEQTERTQLTVKAKASGYDSGLKFLGVQAQVRATTGKTITPRTEPRKAARMIVTGQDKKSRRRAMIPRLFKFDEASHAQWTEFMSP
jgi:hypothetical protein